MTAKEEEKQKDETEEKSNNSNHSMQYALIGGVVGAGVGLLTNPGTSKKIMKSLSESEIMRVAGNELKRTAKDIITEQAVGGLRQTATSYMKKFEGNLLPSKNSDDKEKSSSEEEDSSKYDEIKEDNEKLNDRLEKIENMLSELVESKK